MGKALARFLANDAGTTAIEYSLLAGLIAVIMFVTVQVLGANLSAK